MNISIANRLMELRKKNNYSQEELAEKLGVSRQSVSKWERAEASPDTDNLIELAKIYGLSLDELINTDINLEEVKEKSKEKNSYVKVSIPGIVEVETSNKKTKVNAPISKHDMLKKMSLSIMWMFALIAYLLVGFLSKNYHFSWSTMWVLFLVPIVVESIFRAIEDKRISKFNMPVLIAITYCFIGIGYGLWHPYWVIWFAIPLFYGIVGPIDHYVHKDIMDEHGKFKEDDE